MVESKARRGRTAAKAPRLRTRATAEAPPERVQKALARAGFGSRCLIETWIAAGRVQINGRIAQPGDRAGPSDEIRIDGQTVPAGLTSPADRKATLRQIDRFDNGARLTLFLLARLFIVLQT